jgi:manganese/zinc/iron transport system ATP- binding protein
MSALALSVKDLTLSYDAEPVVEHVSFEVPQGALVGVLGPNGAGKSTLIKAIVGALRPDAGDIEVLGTQGKQALRRLTYVPQRGSVDWDFPVTVRDVVTQGCLGRVGLLGRISGEEKRIVDEALERVAMTELADRQIGALSGGQQQRVFLGRALAQRGDVYLLDEPFVGVDARTESAIIDVLRMLRDEGRTLLVVHHDLSTVREYFDHVLLLNKRLIAFGPTSEVFLADTLQHAYGGRLAIFEKNEHVS